MRRSLLCLLVVCAFLGTGGVAAAQKPPVAILDFSLEGSAPPELRAELERGLEQGIQDMGFAPVSREEVARRLADAPELVGCTTTTCLERVALKLECATFLRARVQASGAAYTIALELLVTQGAPLPARKVEKSCPVCTIGEATVSVAQAARELVRPGGPALLPVQVTSTPPGARVAVDGRELGQTPLSIELSAGRYTFRFSAPGHATLEKSVEVGRGGPDETREVSARLVPVTRVGLGARAPAWLKWGTASVAGAALVAGVALMVLDGRTKDCPQDLAPGARCQHEYETALAGWLVTSGAAALGGVSVWLFVEAPGDAARPSPAGRGAAGLSLAVPF